MIYSVPQHRSLAANASKKGAPAISPLSGIASYTHQRQSTNNSPKPVKGKRDSPQRKI
jgi:hypothetical protein